jgi:hypothetical protein
VLSDEQVAALKGIMQPAVMQAFIAETGDEGQKLLDLLAAQ